MPNATRTNTHSPVTGKWVYLNDPTHPVYNGVSSMLTGYDIVVDDKGPGDNRSFFTSHYRSSGTCSFTYRNWNGTSKIAVDNIPLSNVSGLQRDYAAHLSLGGPSDGAYASELLARTNPSRPSIDLPVFLFELREIPELFKVVGENLFKTVAKSNLAYHFGWKPLVSDLIKIINFHDIVDSKYNELVKLYTSGLSRTIELDRLSASGLRNVASTPLNIYNTCYVASVANLTSVSTEQIVKGHVKWRPTSLPPGGRQAMRNLAMRAALGLYVNPAAAWELIPFSWLADWFTSIGSFLNAQRNLIPAQPYDISIMRETQTVASIPYIVRASGTGSVSGITAQPWLVTQHTKQRQPSSPTISAHLPWLTPRQWSILLSLSVVKGSNPLYR